MRHSLRFCSLKNDLTWYASFSPESKTDSDNCYPATQQGLRHLCKCSRYKFLNENSLKISFVLNLRQFFNIVVLPNHPLKCITFGNMTKDVKNLLNGKHNTINLQKGCLHQIQVTLLLIHTSPLRKQSCC